MNVRLFKDTLIIVNKCFPKGKNITADEFLYFLLGYNGRNSEYDKILLALEEALSCCLAGTKTLRAALGEHYATVRLRNSKLQLHDLVKVCPGIDGKDIRDTQARLSGMQNELRSLCEKYSLPCSGSKSTEQMFCILFTACITEESPCLFASQKKQQLKPATLKGTLGRADDSKNLLRCLEQYHKIIISGQHGSGKSRFIQYCLSVWNLADYCCVTYANDLKSTIGSIPFYKDEKKILTASEEDLMNSSYSSSLLVINQMNESDCFAEELEKLASYATNIIVITTSDIRSDTFHTFRLSPLSDDTLLGIFENITGIALTDKDRELLLDISQKNVLLVSLIAGQYRQLARQATDSSGILSMLLSGLDNTLSVHLPSAASRSLTYKHPYNRKTLDIFGHIKSVYANFADKYKKTSPLRRTMQFLCCFGYSVIPLSFLAQFSEYDQQSVNTLSDMGWIVKTDSTIQLPSLIARSVFAFEIPDAADCSGLIDIMKNFLSNYDQTLDMPYLSSILFVFVSSVYAKIKIKNNPGQQQAAAYFEKWQDFVYAVYYYYMENGEFRLAEKMTQMIYYPDISHQHSELDLPFFQFSVHMSQQNWIGKIPEEADRLSAIMENINTLLYARTNTTSFLITTMDNAVYLYCNRLFSYYNDIRPGNSDMCNINALKRYLYTIFNVIDRTLRNIPNPMCNIDSNLSVAQYGYYQLCHTLIYSPECIYSRLFEPFILDSTVASPAADSLASRLLSETNSNYRIRGIAFTMFMRSIYRKDLQIRLHPSACTVDSQMLIWAINGDINRLHNQVTACEHIPWHTAWICLYCYLQLMTERSTLYQKCNQQNTPIYPSYILKSLLRRSTFSKEELSKAYEKITPYFSI